MLCVLKEFERTCVQPEIIQTKEIDTDMLPTQTMHSMANWSKFTNMSFDNQLSSNKVLKTLEILKQGQDT